MRLRSLRRCPGPVRRSLLSGGDTVHYLRSRSRLSVSVGGLTWRHRDVRVLVDDRISDGLDDRVHLRMEKGSIGMGVIETSARPIPPGREQDLLLRAATEEVQDRGFVVATL